MMWRNTCRAAGSNGRSGVVPRTSALPVLLVVAALRVPPGRKRLWSRKRRSRHYSACRTAAERSISWTVPARIAAYDRAGQRQHDHRLNPLAREQAAALDAERASGVVRGPMHGVPVLMKDNYDMAWMPTTGSSLALAGLRPADNAFQVKRLLDAGAVILGKTNLHELAAGITTISSLGGQTRNPYDPARNPGGSSGGTGAAVAASFAALPWGSDTCGSIRIPASVTHLSGCGRPGAVQASTGLPLSHSQDTGGPLARTGDRSRDRARRDVGLDPADPATTSSRRETPNFRLRSIRRPGRRPHRRTEAWMAEQGSAGTVTRVIACALAEMETLGATGRGRDDPRHGTTCSPTPGSDRLRVQVRPDGLPPPACPTRPSRRWKRSSKPASITKRWTATSAAATRAPRAAPPELTETMDRRRALTAAVLDFLDREDLDALAYPTMRQETALIGAAPTGATCFLSAHTGLPALTIPAGFTERGLPVGLELLGRSLDDARLVASRLRAAHPKRQPPSHAPWQAARLPPPPHRHEPPAATSRAVWRGHPTGTHVLAHHDVGHRTADVYGTVRAAPREDGRRSPALAPEAGHDWCVGCRKTPARIRNGDLERLVQQPRPDHRSPYPGRPDTYPGPPKEALEGSEEASARKHPARCDGYSAIPDRLSPRARVYDTPHCSPHYQPPTAKSTSKESLPHRPRARAERTPRPARKGHTHAAQRRQHPEMLPPTHILSLWL